MSKSEQKTHVSHMQRPSLPCFLTPKVTCCFLLGGTTILRASQGKKRQISPGLGNAVCILGVSAPIPQLLWRMTSVRLLGWTGGQLFRLHYSLDFCSCFQGFHPLRPSGTSLIVGPRTKWMASVCPSFSLSSSNICFFLPKVQTAPEHGFVGGKDFGVCALLLSTQLKDRLLMWWILLHFCPTVGLLYGLSLIGLHEAQASFMIAGQGVHTNKVTMANSF